MRKPSRGRRGGRGIGRCHIRLPGGPSIGTSGLLDALWRGEHMREGKQQGCQLPWVCTKAQSDPTLSPDAPDHERERSAKLWDCSILSLCVTEPVMLPAESRNRLRSFVLSRNVKHHGDRASYDNSHHILTDPSPQEQSKENGSTRSYSNKLSESQQLTWDSVTTSQGATAKTEAANHASYQHSSGTTGRRSVGRTAASGRLPAARVASSTTGTTTKTRPRRHSRAWTAPEATVAAWKSPDLSSPRPGDIGGIRLSAKHFSTAGMEQPPGLTHGLGERRGLPAQYQRLVTA